MYVFFFFRTSCTDVVIRAYATCYAHSPRLLLPSVRAFTCAGSTRNAYNTITCYIGVRRIIPRGSVYTYETRPSVQTVRQCKYAHSARRQSAVRRVRGFFYLLLFLPLSSSLGRASSCTPFSFYSVFFARARLSKAQGFSRMSTLLRRFFPGAGCYCCRRRVRWYRARSAASSAAARLSLMFNHHKLTEEQWAARRIECRGRAQPTRIVPAHNVIRVGI